MTPSQKKTDPGIGIKVGVGSGIPPAEELTEKEKEKKEKTEKKTGQIIPSSADYSSEASEVRLAFKIDRSKESCRTPARNEDTKAMLKFLKKLYTWSDMV